MVTKADRDIIKLKKGFLDKVIPFLKDNPEIFVTEAWRSEERQKELISKWLSKVKRSNHQDWLAIDIWFKGKELYPVDMKKWRKVADSAKKYGIDWGYDLWKRDKPHFQNWLLVITSTIMKFYEEIYKKENPKWGKIITDPQGAINRVVDKDWNIDISELIYLMLIAIERVWRK